MEDVAETPIGCVRCGEEFQDTDAKSTTLCGHTYHTRCMLETIVSGGFYIRELRCAACDEHIVTDDLLTNHIDTITEANDQSALHNWNNRPEFKAGLQAIKPFKRDMNKAATASQAKARSILAELKAATNEQIAAIKEKVREAKKKFHDSVERKEYVKLTRGYNLRVSKFTKRWSTSLWSIHRMLWQIPEAKPLIPDHYYRRHRRSGADYMFNVRIS